MSLKRKFNIAIVEDDDYYNRLLVKTVQELCSSLQFEMFDFLIKSYLSGKKCVDNLEKDTNLVILDHYLDAYDESLFNAFDVMQAINAKCRNCKVIVVSGQRRKVVEEKLRIKGAYDYIDKETDGTEHLCDVITQILEAEKNKMNHSALDA